MKALIGFVAGMILLIIGAFFAGANDIPVAFDYLLGTSHWPLSYLLLLTFLSGGLIAFLIVLPAYLRWQADKVRLKRKLSQQRKELDHLRALPAQQKDLS